MQFEHSFQELGIPLDGGWTFGSISGKCTVIVDEIGDWWIEDIHVDISKLTKSGWVHNSHMLDNTKPTEQRWYYELRKIIHQADQAEIDEEVAERMPVTYEPRSTISAGRSL